MTLNGPSHHNLRGSICKEMPAYGAFLSFTVLKAYNKHAAKNSINISVARASKKPLVLTNFCEKLWF